MAIYFAPMKIDVHVQILGALLVVLRPIARALLKVGIGYHEFAEAARTAFVETATKDYGLRGRPTNISRVAIMTGLTRKEVSRIRKKSQEINDKLIVRSTPLSQVLHRWHTDKNFLSESGTPTPLHFASGAVSFTDLVRTYGGDVPPGAMRTELKRIDAIEILDDGMLVPLQRVPYSTDMREKLVGGLAKIIYPAALNLVHNMESELHSERWTNLVATSKYINPTDQGRVKSISAARLEQVAENLDDLLGAYEALDEESKDGDPKSRAIGVGVFYFEEDKGETDIFA